MSILKISAIVLYAVIIVLLFTGWVKSIVKFTQTDFKPPYKAEIIYGLGAFTGGGSVVGWLNIAD